MTIDKLLNCTATELKAMSQTQLEEYFAPYLNITRPDRATKPEAAKPKASSAQKAMISETTDMLAALGINFKL